MFSRDYPATLTPNGEGGFIVSFRDVPEAITEIWSMEELQDTAVDALVTVLEMTIWQKKLLMWKLWLSRLS